MGLKKIIEETKKGLGNLLDWYAENELKLIKGHKEAGTYELIFLPQRANEIAYIKSESLYG